MKIISVNFSKYFLISDNKMITSFPGSDFGSNKQRPLSQSMVFLSQLMCAKQKEKIPLNFKAGQGVFTAPVTRGLIISKDTIGNGQKDTTWVVTEDAISMSQCPGIEAPV